MWDATCPDTFAPSYQADATREAGAVAAAAEERKKTKYANLSPSHLFMPVAIETTGVLGPETALFLKDLSNRLRQVTGDDDTHYHLLQRLSVAVQRGNSASVLGSVGGLNMPDLFRY